MKHFAMGDIVWKAAAGSSIRTALIDTADYTVNLATHEFRDTGTIATVAQEETSANMTLIDAATGGVMDANDVTFTATAGDQCECEKRTYSRHTQPRSTSSPYFLTRRWM